MRSVEFVSIGQHAFGFIAIGQEAEGVIAIGQIATGYFALGQMATGIVAVGQLARGVVAVGMVSIGVFSVGMLAGGVFIARAMLGMAAVPGKALILPVMPFPRMDPYKVRDAADLFAKGESGMVRGKVALDGAGNAFVLGRDGSPLPATIELGLRAAAKKRAREAQTAVLAELSRDARGNYVVTRMVALPSDDVVDRGKYVVWFIALTLLVGLAAGFHAAVTLPMVDLTLKLVHAM